LSTSSPFRNQLSLQVNGGTKIKDYTQLNYQSSHALE
jgi:hypothetical protein